MLIKLGEFMMKTTFTIKQVVTATSFAVAVMFGAPVATHYFNAGSLDMISQAHAEDEGGYKQKGKPAGKGSEGHKGGAGNDAGKGNKDVIFKGKGDENRDPLSDRPAWAGAKGGKAGSGGKPGTSGSKKGDLYGDLYVLIRDLVTGVAFTETINGVVYPLVQAYDANGVLLPGVSIPRDPATGDLLTQLPDGTKVFPAEVDFGRLSVARAPAKVTEHSLTEALSKLTVTGAVVTLDAAGRFVITVDGVVTTIDSPLENLALYKAIANLTGTDRTISVTTTLEGGSTPVTYSYTIPDSVNIDMLKASLLAASGDKYGVITLDTVMYVNPIVGVTDDLSAVTYDRKTIYDGKIVTVLVKQADGVTYVATPVNLYDAVFGGVNDTTTTGAIDFASAVNDALQVLEFVHDNEVR